jgi:hypothetical protein
MSVGKGKDECGRTGEHQLHIYIAYMGRGTRCPPRQRAFRRTRSYRSTVRAEQARCR